jgi:hypothetical protein
MGHIEFLIDSSQSKMNSLPEEIGNLEDYSLVFTKRWRDGDYERASDVSKHALKTLDFLANEFLRLEVDRKGEGTYHGTPFAIEMSRQCGRGVTNATRTDHQDLIKARAGNGNLPVHCAIVPSLSLHQLLNKVKHRNPNYMNFRHIHDRHIFVIGVDHTNGNPEGIYEFDIAEFCVLCRAAAAAL